MLSLFHPYAIRITEIIDKTIPYDEESEEVPLFLIKYLKLFQDSA
jgi:hypothetical protein